MMILSLLMLFFTIQSKSLVLNYNRNHSTITVFTPSQQSLVLQIDFSSSDIHLPESFQKQLNFVYLSKHNKNKLIFNPHQTHNKHQNPKKLNEKIFYDFQQQQVEFTDGKVIKISGKIGLKPQNNTFLELLKSSAHKSSSRIDYNVQKQSLQVVYSEQCHNMVKFPLSSQLFYENKEKTISIKDLSSHQLFDKSMIEFLFPSITNDIFTVANDEIQSKQIELIVNGRSNKMSLMQFISPFCHKKGHSHNFSCDFKHIEKQKLQMNRILTFFDFSICHDGIQVLSKNTHQQQTYYILHCILLFFILIACLVYSQDEIVAKWIKKALDRKKLY